MRIEIYRGFARFALLLHASCTFTRVSGGQTVLANDRNGGRLRLIATRYDDDDDDDVYSFRCDALPIFGLPCGALYDGQLK